ncbi:MAG TPA: ABC transporter permease [Tenericutes bacterium]|nr:ABC transporter permease [Mycoplasmatota bacterium]
MLSICIYVISIIMLTFNKEGIKKRNNISSTSIKRMNLELYLGNLVFVLCIFVLINIIAYFLLGDELLTKNGIIFIVNSFVFSICALSIGFLVSKFCTNKESISGVVNIIGLGSSFLCGSFVPLSYLPAYVKSIAKVLPSYWFNYNNDLIANITVFNFNSLRPIIFNMLIILLFALVFFIISIIYSKRKVKFG